MTHVARPITVSTAGHRTRRDDPVEVDRPTADTNVPIMLTPLPAKGVE